MSVIKKLLKPVNKIPSAKPSDELGSSLEHVKSSHDPIFIMKGKHLDGIVSASYALFKKRFPLKTKVEHVIQKPPKLTVDNNLFDFAKHMLSLRVYALPVFGAKENLEGIINARDILSYLKDDKEIFKNLETEKVITGSSHDKVRDIYRTLRTEKTSRIVILDKKKNIQGIIARHDIQRVFMAPPAKGKSVRNKNSRTFIVDNKDLKKFDFPVGEFMKTNVITLPDSSSASEIIKKLILEKVNSVVLVSDRGKPKKIASLKNFLSAISKFEPVEKINFSLTDHHKVLIKSEKEKIQNLAETFSAKIERSRPIKLMEGEVSARYNKKNKVIGFEFHFHVHFKGEKSLSAKVEDKILWNAVKYSMEKVKHQLKRTR